MDRDELLAQMAQVSREGASRALMLHQAVADRFGLGPSDIKCLDLARDEPDLTAGRIAEATGLSASAVTSCLTGWSGPGSSSASAAPRTAVRSTFVLPDATRRLSALSSARWRPGSRRPPPVL